MENALNGSRANIRKLFIICNKLRENTSSVNLIIREIYEVSLRSGIASSHVEVGKRAFNEIAKQIARSSKAMENELVEIKKLGSEISNLSLECLKKSLQTQKMYEAQTLNCGQNSHALKAAMRKMEGHVNKNVNKIEESCKKIILLNGRLAQQSEKLWSLSISLKMEASFSGEEEEVFFSNIAQAVVSASEKLNAQGVVYEKLIMECRSIRATIDVSSEGELHAA